MSKLLSDLRSQTRTYLDEASASDWTSGEVDYEINYAYHQVHAAVVSVFEDYYLTTNTQDLSAETQEYSLPTDFFKLKRVEVKYDTNSSAIFQRALPVQLDDVRRDLGNESLNPSVIRNPGYYTYGFGSSGKLGLIPVPTVARTNGLKIWYIKVLADLSSASDEVNIPYPDLYAYMIPLRAAGTLLRKGQQEEVAAERYILEFERGLLKMKEELEDKIAEESKQVTDVLGETADFGDSSQIYY